jgi:hypothetical protein
MQYNVFLSGGGMKGAYQYGFFKELYVRWPDFPIKKVYAVSVGAMNAVPIVTRRMDALDKYWCNEDMTHPFDTIVDDWEDCHDCTNKNKNKNKNSQKCTPNRFRALLKHGSVFKQVKREPYETFLKDIDADGWDMLRKKLVIISYDKINKKTMCMPCSTIDEIVESVQASTRFPGLFDTVDATHVDGTFANLRHVLSDTDDMWLCLDLQNTLANKIGNSHDANVFYPRITNVPILNEVACLLSTRAMLDNYIKNGKHDAKEFVNGTINGQSKVHLW